MMWDADSDGGASAGVESDDEETAAADPEQMPPPANRSRGRGPLRSECNTTAGSRTLCISSRRIVHMISAQCIYDLGAVHT